MVPLFSISSVNRRLLTVATAAFFLTVLGFLYLWPPTSTIPLEIDHGSGTQDFHPIDTLIKAAQEEWQSLLAKQVHDLATAVDHYRARRGRHPPPGFAEWWEFARSKDAVVVEDFFDQIYADLSPYWGLSPQELRRQARSIETRVVVRNRTASMVTDTDRAWMDSWHSLVQTIQDYLPDLDMPINIMDESRIIVPWETITEYVARERAARHLVPAADAATEYMDLSQIDLEDFTRFDPEYQGPAAPFWELARVGCPTQSPSRQSNIPLIDFSAPPPEMDNYQRFSYHGYVRNWTLAKDPCFRPELQALHGTFIEPVSVSTSHKLFPLFGGSKLPMNNEILIPPAMYWAKNELYSGGENDHGGDWTQKKDALVWRGAATGGRNRPENWTGFQRHRFLSMMNGTTVRQAEKDGHFLNFKLPSYEDYDLQSGLDGRLADFVDRHTDMGFVHLVCFPYDEQDPHCPYTEPFFSVTEGMPMKRQYEYKYLPDIDGNSFSGRYRGFLLSTSLPIKATIYNEWHDSRLVPWAHFVPMDSTFMDIYGIMEYFLGYNGRGGHDAAAQKIALDGKSWAERVLRREDMQIYTYRLLLEYARICDDRRETLAYIHE